MIQTPIPHTSRRRRVVRHSLRSSTYWVAGQRFTTMDSVHLQNVLRFLLRHPLEQFIASHDTWLWEWAQASEHGIEDDQMPDGGDKIFARLVDRWQWDEAERVANADNDDDIDPATITWMRSRSIAIQHLASHLEPSTKDELRAQAKEWIRRSPSFQAMRTELIERIIDNRAQIHDPDRLIPTETPEFQEPF